MSKVHVRAPLRHACSGCGMCCQGSVVHLVSQAEQDRVQEQARILGIDAPVDQGRLRLSEGRCVFLEEDRLCGLHRHFGAHDKPLVCRQFPFVLVQTESGLRGGIDPASTAWWSTRHEGPDLQPPAGAQARKQILPPPQAEVEAHLVAACERDGAGIADLLAMLCARPDAPPELPPGFAARWLAVVQQAPLDELLHHSAVGPDHRAVLLPLVHTAARLQAPPDFYLDRRVEDQAVSLIQDMLWLRLVSRIPLVQATAILLCGGVLLAAWHDPEEEAFALALANWARLLRAGPFWQSLVPDPGRLQWLATGS